jgi:hypothetical protein
MNQLKIEIGDTVKIVATSSYYHALRETNPKCEGVVSRVAGSIEVEWNNGCSNRYQSYDLTLIKKGKTMEFTKSDLIKLSQSETVFVKQRNGDFKIVLGKATFSYDYFMELLSYSEGLTHRNNQKEFDIMSVYKKSSNVPLSYYLKGENLELIWERTEQTEAQKEMEVLQQQAKALQEQITKLQGKL